MVFIANCKIRVSMLCFGMLLYGSLLSYGASTQQPPDQPAVLDKKESPPASLSIIKSPSVKPPVKIEKKKAPKEGVKVAHPGPPPENMKAKGLTIPLTHRPKNPIDLSTGKELTPWTDDSTPKVPAAK